MTDYLHWSKSDLIERLDMLERERASAGAIEHRLAEAALRDSEERIRGIVETAVEGIVTIDHRGIVQSVNPAVARMFGYGADELIGRNVSLLMPSPYREQHDGYIAAYLATGRARIIGIGREVTGQRKDGTVFPMDLSVGEFQRASGRMFAGIVRDITERKLLEKEVLEISDREQERIGQDLHDGLCQQLAGIELVCQTLEEDLATTAPAQAGQARTIAKYVRESIGQARGLARGLSPVGIELDGFVTALRELALSTEKMFGVRCEVSCGDTPVAEKNPAATHLYRIAQEAIHNAIRHGRAQVIVLSIRAGERYFELRVEDDGSGLPADVQSSRGMGLRIMKYRAGMIGGTLEIDPRPEGGTIVRCLFPAQS